MLHFKHCFRTRIVHGCKCLKLLKQNVTQGVWGGWIDNIKRPSNYTVKSFGHTYKNENSSFCINKSGLWHLSLYLKGNLWNWHPELLLFPKAPLSPAVRKLLLDWLRMCTSGRVSEGADSLDNVHVYFMGLQDHRKLWFCPEKQRPKVLESGKLEWSPGWAQQLGSTLWPRWPIWLLCGSASSSTKWEQYWLPPRIVVYTQAPFTDACIQ